MTETSAPISRALRGLRLTYFARFGGSAFLSLYVNLFYRNLGLSGTQIGALGTIAAISSLLAAPNWGRLSDHTGRPRRLLQAAMLASIIAVYLLSRQTVFGWLALLVAINAMAQAAYDPLCDSMTISLTQGLAYGSIRLFGSLGWAAFVFVAGWLIETFGLSFMFVGYISLMSVAALLLLTVPLETGGYQRPAEGRVRLSEGLRIMLGSPVMRWLLIALAIQQLSYTSILIFEPVFLSDLGAGGLIGLGFAVAAMIEVPSMLWADRQLKMRGGEGLLRVGELMGALRALTIVLFPIAPVLIGGRAIEGFGYAFRQVSTVVLVTRNAPRGLNTTVLALYTTTLTGVMQMIGAPLAGLVYDHLGAYWLYVFATAAYLATFAILWLVFPPRRGLSLGRDAQ